MNKIRVLSQAKQLSNMAFNSLLDIKEELKEELNALLWGSHSEAVEEIEDLEARKLGFRLKETIDLITHRADKLSDWLDLLDELDLEDL